MFIKIVLIVLAVLFWGVTLAIAFVFGLIKGYKNLLSSEKTKWGKFDAALYKQLVDKTSEKEISDKVAKFMGDKRFSDFQDEMKIQKREKELKKNKEVNKKKLKKK